MNMIINIQKIIYSIVSILFVFFLFSSNSSLAAPPGIDIEPPQPDNIVETLQLWKPPKDDWDAADGLIRDLLSRRRHAASEQRPFIVPEFETLVSGMEADIKSWIKNSKMNAEENQTVAKLVDCLERLKSDNYPYEETILATARYTLVITLLHQRRDPSLVANRYYHGIPYNNKFTIQLRKFSVNIEEIFYDDFFTNNVCLKKSENCYIRDMSKLPEWLANPDIMLYPVHDELFKNEFVQTYPFPFYFIGVSRKPYTTADGNQMSSACFFSHDLDHTDDMLNYWEKDLFCCSTNSDEPDIGGAIDKRVMVRNQYLSLQTIFKSDEIECLIDKLFNLSHERVVSLLSNTKNEFNDLPYHQHSIFKRFQNKVSISACRFQAWMTKKNDRSIDDDSIDFSPAIMQDNAHRFWLHEQKSIEDKLDKIMLWTTLYSTISDNPLYCDPISEEYYRSFSSDSIQQIRCRTKNGNARFFWYGCIKNDDEIKWLLQLLSTEYPEILPHPLPFIQ